MKQYLFREQHPQRTYKGHYSDYHRYKEYLTADNVALLSARKGLDPRLGLGLGSSTAESGANTTSSYSAMRTITGGISLTF